MKRSVRWSAAAAVAALCGCVGVVDQGGSPAQTEPTPQQIVAARQAALHLSGATMGQIKGAIDRGAEVRTQTYAARGIARWARVLPTLFPDSTRGITPTRARPEIWENRADFEARAATYAEAADRLAELAQAGEREAFAAQFQTTIATCQACHERYQVPAARSR